MNIVGYQEQFKLQGVRSHKGTGKGLSAAAAAAGAAAVEAAAGPHGGAGSGAAAAAGGEAAAVAGAVEAAAGPHGGAMSDPSGEARLRGLMKGQGAAAEGVTPTTLYLDAGAPSMKRSCGLFSAIRALLADGGSRESEP